MSINIAVAAQGGMDNAFLPQNLMGFVNKAYPIPANRTLGSLPSVIDAEVNTDLLDTNL